ncbi:CYB protein, partial [Cercotrichas coryphoeus]|nr:CYB protein [Cercotrichas coryphoeus]
TFLHPTFFPKSGSNNPQGIVSNCGKTPFHPYFSTQDIIMFILVFLLLLTLPAY